MTSFAPARSLGPGMTLQPPLSRCGRGPGLVLLRPHSHAICDGQNTGLDPAPVQKWAEESYAVVQITIDESESLRERVNQAVDELRSLPECDQEKLGLLVYGSTEEYPPSFASVLRESAPSFAAAVSFADHGISDIPVLLHLAPPTDQPQTQPTKVYTYPEASSPQFILPGHGDFIAAAAGVAHSRSLTFVKKYLDGPYFDLEKIWDEHTFYEFEERLVEKTMATMVQEPYVNHTTTLTGGIGRAKLSNFYLNHFIFQNPKDTRLELISRTVGVDRVVDEFICHMTHNMKIDWMLPGLPPTGKPLQVPFTAVVNIRGDRLYHEHIAWDQATVLVQLGLMPQYLPYPYALDGREPGVGKRFEYRVPAAGAECAAKLQNEHLVESNGMFAGKAIAQRLIRENYSVCINDTPSSTAEIQSLVHDLNSSQSQSQSPSRPNAIGIPADVTSPSAVSAMVSETVRQLGPLTLMVANAGIAQVKPLLSCSSVDIERLFEVNFNGVFNCYTEAARQMIAQGPPSTPAGPGSSGDSAGVGVYKILGAASIVAHKPFATLGLYSASKFAVRGLTQAFAMEMAPHNITVNAYAPGIVDTPMWEGIDAGLGAIQGRAKGDSMKVYSERLVALGRTSQPDDVAGVVGGFLAGRDSDYVTGQTVVVDGGVVFT
ncbi:NAD(P)-binding protein [Aspergillus steynii IBT 23096]|uniref:NAD(P)-binding protein n=1 Tax=Aspergillus steynii IBT 23096 TaxID=1392250 RepID=A0A2I2GAT9_9EURO|nr:NAD(P)-binding protein [Aspergillus steynii IBT 23096]PLB50001.1 NAD(P)-binding protein [Aspergillus steynii IBT 23096]